MFSTIPELTPGERSPTLGHEATDAHEFDSLAKPFITHHPFHGRHAVDMTDAEGDFGRTIHAETIWPKESSRPLEKKENEVHSEKAENRAFESKRPFSEFSPSGTVTSHNAEDSPTGKKFTEHLHNRDSEGHFVESSNRKKPKRKED